MIYPIRVNNKFGFVNNLGQIEIEPQFSFGTYEPKEFYIVSNKLDEVHFIMDKKEYYHSEFTYLNQAGLPIFPFTKYYFGRDFSEGYAFIYHEKQRKWGVIDRKCNTIIPFELDYNCNNSTFSEGLARVQNGSKLGNLYGFIDINGNSIIQNIYDYATDFKEGYSFVKLNKKGLLIDKKGDLLTTIKCEILSGFSNGFAKVQINKKIGFINIEGKLAFDNLYDSAYEFNENFCGVGIDGKIGFIKEFGKVAINFKFDACGKFQNGLCPVKIATKWTLIDKSGTIKFEPIFEYIDSFKDSFDLTTAIYNKERVYINKTGEIICKYDSIVASFDEIKIKDILKKVQIKKDTWDKAKWSYDGFTITKKGAIKPFYFVLKWLKSKDLLTQEGIECFKDKNNLDIGLFRFMVNEQAGDFLDYFYDYWFENQHIVNYQIDPELKFDADENLNKYWDLYLMNKK